MARIGHASKPKPQCPSKKPWHAALAWVVHELPRESRSVQQRTHHPCALARKLLLKYLLLFFARGHGLGDIEKLTLEQWVADILGLKVKPSSDAIINTSMLPSRNERMIPIKA